MSADTMSKIWHVSLTVEVLACVEVNPDYPKDVVSMIAREAVSLFPTGQRDVSLEIERITVDDIVNLTQESNDVR